MKIDGSSPPTVSVTTSNFFIRCFSTKKEEGFILEQSLSVDNLFVFVLIFKYFKVPTLYQRFQAVNLLLAAILLFLSFKAYTTVKFADACLQTLKGEFEIIHVHMLIHR
ncbi:unnamed protein product [Vicia faba]|uniref:Uncharacterized protein n=1 Tax=Vicia faba TaxID=3906 RepID=A0AAV0Z4E0_VICFA|nr:unnamed protein product [Vicia faba]